MATSVSGKYHGDGKYKKEEDTMVMVNATKQKDIENNAKTFSTDAFMQQDATMLDLARGSLAGNAGDHGGREQRQEREDSREGIVGTHRRLGR